MPIVLEPLCIDEHLSLEEFWIVLRDSAWRRRPVVFRNLYDVSFGNSADVLAGLRSMRGNIGAAIRLYLDRKLERNPGWAGCSESDTSLEGLCTRLTAHTGCQELCYAVDDMQACGGAMWYKSLRFLKAMHETVGFPAGEASLNLFMGRYLRTPFGFHKDREDVVTCVVEGRKRFLAWPFEVMCDYRAIRESALRRECNLPDFDYSALRAAAFVLEGGPGDVFYWPWDYWHVAESDGGFSATLALGTVPFATPVAHLERAMRRADHWAEANRAPRTGEQSDEMLDAYRRSIEDSLRTPAVLAALKEEIVLERTRFGFKSIPMPRGSVELDDADWLALPARGLIAWLVDGDEMIVSACGHGFRIASTGPLVRLLEDLNTADRVQVRELRKRYCAHWRMDAADLEQVLERLCAFHALTVAR
jgi:hypothetical protein